MHVKTYYRFNERVQTAEESLLRFLSLYKEPAVEPEPFDKSRVQALLAMSDKGCVRFADRFVSDGSADDVLIPVDIISEYLQEYEKNDVHRSTFQNALEHASVNGEIAFTELCNLFPNSYIEHLFVYLLTNQELASRTFGVGFLMHRDQLAQWVTASDNLLIYRSITLSSDAAELSKDALLFDGVGRYWTYDPLKASSYWSTGLDNYSYTLVAEVNASEVEWADTVYKTMYKLKEEKEVFVKADAVVKIIDVIYNDKCPRRASTNYITYVNCGTQKD